MRAFSLSGLINGRNNLPYATECVCIGVLVLYSIAASLLTKWL